MRYLWLLLPLFLAACGPSQEEIDNTATITCNIMGESRNMDAAMRIKEINSARDKIGGEPYLGSDEGIKESFKWGLCEELVKNDPQYDIKLDELKKIQAKIDEENLKKAQARAAQLESEKLAREQKAEAERLAKLEANEATYRSVLEKYFKDNPIKPALSSISFNKSSEKLQVALLCDSNMQGIDSNLHLRFIGSRAVTIKVSVYTCSSGRVNIESDAINYDDFYYDEGDLESKLESAELEILSVREFAAPSSLTAREKRTLKPSTYDLPYSGLSWGKGVSYDVLKPYIEKLAADKEAAAARAAEQIEARKNAEKILKEANFRCPRTSQELTDGIRAALELGNTTVYRALVSCPKPSK